jgi:hypothetical protein
LLEIGGCWMSDSVMTRTSNHQTEAFSDGTSN